MSSRFAVVLLLALAGGCASAGKRLEQGREAEARGDWSGAASRYVDALEKDAALSGAREALLVAWDSALALGARRASGSTGGDPLAAAAELRRLDAIRARAAEMRVALAVPDTWGELRRATFDGAIAALMRSAEGHRRDARWRDARAAYQRIRRDFEPSPVQRRASLDAEAAAVVDQAGAEATAGRFRAAYELTVEALGVSNQLPAEIVEAATELQRRAIASGLKVLAVFPVESTADVRRASLADLNAQLSDILDAEYWPRPPFFVAVGEPARVRQITRRLTPPGAALDVRRVLDEVGGDFGALVTLTALQAVERDVKASTRSARTRDGRTLSYALEDGRIEYTLVAEVTLFDAAGRALETFTERNQRGESFRRARYDGDFEELDLTRSERLLFNPGEERRQRAALQQSLLSGIAGDVARGAFERVVRRIP